MKRIPVMAGCAVLAACWIGPFPQGAQHAFFAHMTLHMLVVAVAAPLLALGLAGSRLDPVCRWPSLLPPIPVSLLELALVWAWHAPALHHAARHTGSGFLLEQASFFSSGLLLWLAVLGGTHAQREQRRGAGAAALLLTFMHMTLLGALLGLSPRILYAHGGGEGGRMSPLQDQQLGGAIMLLAGALSYIGGGLYVMAGLLRDPARKEEVAA